MGRNIERLVHQVHPILLSEVAQDPMLGGTRRRGVEMDEILNVATDAVVQPASLVDVDEAIAHPFSSGDGVRYLVQQVKASVYSVLRGDLPHGNGRRSHLRIVAEDICGVLARQEHHVAGIGPVHLLGAYVDLSNKISGFPIVKQDGRIAALDADHLSTEQSLRRGRRRSDGLGLLEVLEHLDR